MFTHGRIRSSFRRPVYFEQQRYNLAIDNPKESAVLKIVNSNGCVIEENIIIEDITPLFDYTSISLSYDAPSNSIYVPAREEILFTDLSTGPYVSAEWNFGDGSDTVLMPANTTSPVVHEYGISGIRITSAPPAIPEFKAIWPASRPITSKIIALL